MGNFKEKFLENDFGAYLYDLRVKKGYTVEELAQIINMPNVTIKSIKKWEHDLEFPNLEQMYRLSEIYEVPSEELMQVRTRTLEEGLKGVHTGVIRFIGYIFGFSVYTTVILSYITIAVAGIWSILYFADGVNKMAQSFR